MHKTIFILAFVLSVFSDGKKDKKFIPDPCSIYGVVYVESNKRRADYIVYKEETEAFADVNIFREDNKLMADDEGLWFFTDQPAFADFTIYYESEDTKADFTIYFTDEIAYAGCK